MQFPGRRQSFDCAVISIARFAKADEKSGAATPVSAPPSAARTVVPSLAMDANYSTRCGLVALISINFAGARSLRRPGRPAVPGAYRRAAAAK